jgi:hypothetical protein
VPIALKSGNLNLLEPSGPVQARTGLASPFLVALVLLLFVVVVVAVVVVVVVVVVVFVVV